MDPFDSEIGLGRDTLRQRNYTSYNFWNNCIVLETGYYQDRTAKLNRYGIFLETSANVYTTQNGPRQIKTKCDRLRVFLGKLFPDTLTDQFGRKVGGVHFVQVGTRGPL